jgi:hypothetical protein
LSKACKGVGEKKRTERRRKGSKGKRTVLKVFESSGGSDLLGRLSVGRLACRQYEVVRDDGDAVALWVELTGLLVRASIENGGNMRDCGSERE